MLFNVGSDWACVQRVLWISMRLYGGELHHCCVCLCVCETLPLCSWTVCEVNVCMCVGTAPLTSSETRDLKGASVCLPVSLYCCSGFIEQSVSLSAIRDSARDSWEVAGKLWLSITRTRTHTRIIHTHVHFVLQCCGQQQQQQQQAYTCCCATALYFVVNWISIITLNLSLKQKISHHLGLLWHSVHTITPASGVNVKQSKLEIITGEKAQKQHSAFSFNQHRCHYLLLLIECTT